MGRTWFRTHRKKIAVHFLILSAFLIYLLLPDSFFDRFISNENIAKPQKISLPKETNNIRFFIDQIKNITTESFIEIKGWAFIEDHGMEESAIYLVLKSDDQTYIFDTLPVKRRGVTKKQGNPGQNLDDSGYYASIPKKTMESGEYKIGIYIKKPEVEALQITNKVISLSQEPH